MPSFYELLVTGWGGVAPPESGMSPVPGSDNWSGRGDWQHMVNESQWDGSDFFIVWPFPLFKFVTDRVAKFIRKNKLSGVKLVDPARFELHKNH